jgi:lysophospholipase L1-like esterase
LALYSGHLYTRVAPAAYRDRWAGVTTQPTYHQWRSLLAQEAAAVAAGQGPNRLEIVLGDSIGLWLPTDTLPRDRLWLNQGISGDTTAGILARLDPLAPTRPTVIHLMVGVNDLKNNVPEAQILENVEQIVAQLQRQHPQARLVIYSVLPTRHAAISGGRVRSLNHHMAYLAAQRQVDYRDLHRLFRDPAGSLRADLTTDGIHLNRQGYALWQQVMLAVL